MMYYQIPRQASRVAEFNVTVSVKVGTVLLLATAKDRTNSAVTDSVERELLVKVKPIPDHGGPRGKIRLLYVDATGV
ncbi:hypothetical protein DPMN_178345 [Dreissena polymorpha]|uniref:Uncharacterized protein n=1 Tax=Dreissena polymorpha TaxID=45954 RepID=A0A9D4EBX0_DREPO|nr:hypothetical protein DPMN_178345 [Dreissena polymorpha]